MELDPSDPVTADAAQRVGTVLKDKWRLDALIGVGGMASVYAATHRNRSRVAVKVLHPALSVNRHFRERFLREGYAANTVGHPSVVQVHDDDVTDDGCAFLVMELLDGESLYARWRRHGQRLPPEEVLAITEQVLAALVSAHQHGIVHRDLKPENLFLTHDGRVKVLDFGIARLREVGGQAATTQTGSAMGTPAFMPPEQALGQWDRVDARTDIWALGATMFTLLSGEHVHDAPTVNETLVRAATRPAPSLASVVPAASPALCAVVDRALAFEASARFQSADEMLAALVRVRAEPGNGSTVIAGASLGETPKRSPAAQQPSSVSGATVSTPSVDRSPSSEMTAGPLEVAPRGESRRAWLIAGAALAATLVFAVYWVTGKDEPAREATTPTDSAIPAAATWVDGSPTAPPAAEPAARPSTQVGPLATAAATAAAEPAALGDPLTPPRSKAKKAPSSGAPKKPPPDSKTSPPRDPFSSRN